MSAADKIEAALLPCPFCGSAASAEGAVRYSRPVEDCTWGDGDPVTEAFFCNCPRCGVSNQGPLHGYRTKDKAIAAWNRRADLADAQAQEIARLMAENERMRKMLQPEWFYAADGYESEACRWSVGEVLDEDYFWGRPKTGQHVVEINVATALPSIWAAVRFTCECADPDECECDNDMIVTEHASETEARAALGDTP